MAGENPVTIEPLDPQQPTPDGPPEAPASTAAAAQAPSQARPPVALQATLSRQGRTLAALREAAGVDKGIDDAELIEAVRSRFSQPAVHPAMDESMDESLVKEWAAITEAKWGLVEASRGKAVAGGIRQLMEVALTTGDPQALASAFDQVVKAMGPQAPPAQPPVNGQAPAGQPAPDGADIEMEAPHGGFGLRQPSKPLSDGLEGSGNTREGARRFLSALTGRAPG